MKKRCLLGVLFLTVAMVLQAQSGRYLELDGVDDYMVIPSHDDLNKSATQDLSISFYARFDKLSANARVVSKRNMETHKGSTYDMFLGASGYGINVKNEDETDYGKNIAATLAANRWYHFAIVFSAAESNYKVYQNGFLMATVSITKGITNTHDVIIGALKDTRNANPFGYFMDGAIDNLRFWRKALTLNDIYNDMTAEVVAGQADLMAAYDFQNVVGGIVPDISGRGHNATIYGQSSGGAGVVSYCTPAYTTEGDQASSVANRYISRASTSGATGNITSYSASSSSAERYVHYTAEQIRTQRGQTFTLNLVSPSNGAVNLSDGMQYTQSDVYADWNCDGVFDDTEKILHTGSVNAGSDAQCNLTHSITVPAEAAGGNSRIRVRYYDAWTTNHPAPTACSAGYKSFTVDFDMYIDAPAAPMSVAGVDVAQETIWAGQGNSNEPIVRANVSVIGSGEPLQLSSVSVGMDGTTSASDVSKVKVYIADDNSTSFDLSRATFYGEAEAQDGTVVVEGDATLKVGVNTLWVTYDVCATALEGNKLDASVLSLSLGNGATYTVAQPSPAGDRTILLGHTTIFKQNTAGSLYYRIPAIITAADGSLVAAADKRWDTMRDLDAHLDVVVSRSTDNGKTWSAPITIAGKNTNVGYGDPALVLDKVVNPGTLICVFASNASFWGSTYTNQIRINMSKSTDHGLTWTEPVDITSQIYGPGTNNLTNIYGAFAASGRALQLKDGRIMFVIAARNTSVNGGTTMNFVAYSDNGGATWQSSANSPTPMTTNNITTTNGDESKLVELANGNVLMSIRNRNNEGYRLYAISTDRGITWSQRTVWNNFVATNCNGDVLYYTYAADGYTRNRMLHSIPDHASIRQNVSVKLTYDEGTTWAHTKSICEGMSAYSSLTILPDNTIGIFYEKGDNAGMDLCFARFSLKWLTDGVDTELDEYHTVTLTTEGGDGVVSLESAVDHSMVRSGGAIRNGERIVLKVSPEVYSGVELVTVNGVPATLTGNQLEIEVNEAKNIRVVFATTATRKLGNKRLTVAPNPTFDFLRIVSADVAVAEAHLYDLAGHQLLSQQATDLKTIDLGAVAGGTYILQLVDESNNRSYFRIVKR